MSLLSRHSLERIVLLFVFLGGGEKVEQKIQPDGKSGKELPLRLSKNPFGAFRQVFAVCRAHNLSPDGGQIPHLQPVKYVPPGTRPGETWFLNHFTPDAGKEAALFLTRSGPGLSPGPYLFMIPRPGSGQRWGSCFHRRSFRRHSPPPGKPRPPPRPPPPGCHPAGGSSR